ncbi:MAG: hypothetical protein VW437_03350 [Betaproteobacteria bacterium]
MAITAFKRLQNKYIPLTDIDQNYDILSANKVTGYSVNFPIAETCQPSKVCAETCYGLRGPIVWSSSLTKHAKNYVWVKKDPKGFSKKLELECRKKLAKDPQFFLRWNGVGDLFPESSEALLHLNEAIPELPIWCVTRIPEAVPPLVNRKNVWIHFSLDRESLDRKRTVESLVKGVADNLFFSYQADKDERLEIIPEDISVLFFDAYTILATNLHLQGHDSICPLNLSADIANVCYECRRCFNQKAVEMRKGKVIP